MILRPNKPGVVLSPETAYLLEKHCNVKTLRMRLRGENSLVSQELLDLREVAMQHEPPALPEAEGPSAEVAPQWITTAQIADLEGVTDRAVRLRCQAGQMDAEQIDGRWRISVEAYEQYRAARASMRRDRWASSS